MLMGLGRRGVWHRIGGAAVVGLTLAAVVGCDLGTPVTPAATPLPSVAATGQAVFARYCTACHPGGGRGSGPSLITSRESDAQRRAIVRQGHRPMPAFGPDVISDADLDALLAYVRT
ncbi:MAG: cytochrome c, partial [Chloroflexota bacterium]|nr:cytochrome c [Chloroflexota bacterium]